MKWIRKGVMFCLGGSAYVGLELLYRGRSHSSMFAAGGLSFLLLGKIREKQNSPAVKAVLGMGTITAVELATGLLVNRDYTVWDYRQLPYNFRGRFVLILCCCGCLWQQLGWESTVFWTKPGMLYRQEIRRELNVAKLPFFCYDEKKKGGFVLW